MLTSQSRIPIQWLIPAVVGRPPDSLITYEWFKINGRPLLNTSRNTLFPVCNITWRFKSRGACKSAVVKSYITRYKLQTEQQVRWRWAFDWWRHFKCSTRLAVKSVFCYLLHHDESRLKTIKWVPAWNWGGVLLTAFHICSIPVVNVSYWNSSF
jgi:hypothetical protein